MALCQAQVLRRDDVAPGHHLLELECPPVAQCAAPGQFVHVRVGGTSDPLLRRPFSIMLCDTRRGHLQILVRTVGRGTELLAHAAPGNVLDLMGPLGNGFPLPADAHEPLLVAGGVGVAPLVFVADALQLSAAEHYVRGLFGAATEDALVCWQEFAGRCDEFQAATEDGSAGVAGRVTDLIGEQFARGNIDCVYTCGPRPMMATVAELCAAADIPCWASLEQFMGCGIGACLGCVVPTRGETHYERVCTDGPVFDSRHVAWEEEARQ